MSPRLFPRLCCLFVTFLLAALIALRPAASAAAQTTAQIVYPVNGESAADLSKPIQWTSVNGASAYYLYVGSTRGANDLVNTGEILRTSYLATTIPAGQLVYARLWTKLADVWSYADTLFTGATVIMAATLTYPPGGSTTADVTHSLTWTSVAGAQAYYLYVGTVPGAKDVVDSGETQQTSYPAANLPTGRTLYTRIWTKCDDVWSYTDSSFTLTSLLPSFSYPLPGSTSVDVTRAWTWTTVSNAQAYYLYVGSTVGAKDLVDTGEIQQTSYLPLNLPDDRVWYARLWANVNNVWRYTDATFTKTATPTITYPADGSTNADWTQPIRWTTVPNAQAYYLYAGSTPGASDLLDTGELQQTSYSAANLPTGQTVYARMWAKVGGIWRFADSSFGTPPLVATLVYPPNGGVDVDPTLAARWTSVPNVQAYYLYLGTTLAANDIVDTGEMQQTSLPLSGLPTGCLIYARLWTKVGGIWRSSDSSFTAGRVAAEFIAPLDAAMGVDPTVPIQWAAARSAQGYELWLGSSRGTNDWLDSGEIATTRYTATGLPTDGPIYARIWTKIGGQWSRHSDIMFSLGIGQPPVMLQPANGAVAFDTKDPFQWSSAPLARGYRLSIGSAPGASDLHDSGEIHVTRRFVPNLPLGVPLFGRLQAKIGGAWQSTDFTFSVAGNTVAAALQIDTALWATDFVRTMADGDNRPFGGTLLLQLIASRYNAVCGDYRTALLRILSETNLSGPARQLDLAFDPNGSDTHTLVEWLEPGSGRWMLLDPTFDLTARRSDGSWATADAVSQATLASNWSAITYQFLGQAGDSSARGYYLDYPLLYTNVYHDGQAMLVGQGNSPLSFLQPMGVPTADNGQAWTIRCIGTASVDVTLNASSTQLACNGIDSLTPVFIASVGAPSAGQPSFQLYLVPRFVF